MRILVVNCGSSSLKYTLFHRRQEKTKGLIEKIGETSSIFSRTLSGVQQSPSYLVVANHAQAIDIMMQGLIQDGLIQAESDIEAVGHRVVHGGPYFKAAALVDERVRNNRVARELAPLHQVNYDGIEACVQRMPHTPQVAVFDTAFHQTMPPKAYTYALPYRFLTEHNIRRYGFHGTSHKYVAQRCAQLLGKPLKRLNLITLHLGNGCSITAIGRGKSIDTSMGLTPLAGVVMGSRCGDIDPAIVPFIMEREGLQPHAVEQLLNKQSGVLGLSGVSNDLREVIAQAKKHNPRAQLALEVFVYAIQKYIGAYTTVLAQVDALVFTAGIGERSPFLRQNICNALKSCGIWLDHEKNLHTIAQERFIHARRSRVKIAVIPTREEYMIALETERVVKQSRR